MIKTKLKTLEKFHFVDISKTFEDLKLKKPQNFVEGTSEI